MLSAIRAPSIPSTAVEICARAAPHLVRKKILLYCRYKTLLNELFDF